MTMLSVQAVEYNLEPMIVHGFDKLQFRFAGEHRPSPALLAFLDGCCEHVGRVRKGHHIVGSPLAYSLVIVAPDDDALHAISNQPWLVNEAEVARDLIMPGAAAAEAMHDLHDRHFVHRWHGRHETRWIVNHTTGQRTTVSGQRRCGLRYAWYSDRPSKLTGEICFHFEARAVGAEAVKRHLGVTSPADLLRFDGAAFWSRRYLLEAVDCERLGRWHLNSLSKRRGRHARRRRKPRITTHGRFVYNADAALGRFLWRWHGLHPKQRFASVQWLIDALGRGPYLHRMSAGRAALIAGHE